MNDEGTTVAIGAPAVESPAFVNDEQGVVFFFGIELARA
jgi:hypothetical protein